MKKFYTLSFILLVSLSFGQTLLYENFNYTIPGNVGGNTTTTTDAVGSNNWFTHSNTAGNATSIDLTAGSLSYAGITPSTGNKIMLIGSNPTTPRDINRGFTSSATTLYYSALINIVDNTQLSSTLPLTGTNNYFLSFGDKSGGTAISNLAGRLSAVSTNSAANYRLLIQNNSSGTTTPSFVPTYTENPVDLNFGTTYLVVVKLVIEVGNTTTATLWVNPSSLGTTEPASTVINNQGISTSFTSFATGSIIVRNSSATPKVEIDEIRVGVTWADVTPTAPLSMKQNSIAGLNVYPNPVKNGNLYITSNSSNAKTVAVFDILGKQVLNSKTSNNTVNVANLKGGAYIIKITEEGKTDTRKLIIE